jgi:leucyl aminopeptidase (aminopeptidase T)
MPGITEEIIQRTFAADYGLIRERVNRVCDHLDQADSVRVTTESGTDLRMSIEGRLGRGRRGGIYNEKGAWGNLPCGEAFVAPLEETANGVYVVDTVQAGIDKLTVPIMVTVENGKAVEFTGGREAIRLEKLLRDVRNSQAYNVAELGIGCNDRASIASITLEAEKALGTCHVALGSNCHFGGSVEVDVHLDGVLQAPSIVLDGTRILDRGELVPPV